MKGLFSMRAGRSSFDKLRTNGFTLFFTVTLEEF